MNTSKSRKCVYATVGSICLVLIVFMAFFSLTGFSAQNSLSKINSQTIKTASSKDQATVDNSTFLNWTFPVLNDTFPVTIEEINQNSSAWVNKRVIVVGELSGPFAYFTAISYDFVLSSTGTVTDQTSLDSHSIGVDFGNRGFLCNSSTNAVIVGIVKQGIIGNLAHFDQPTIIYYIEEQGILLF
jgi:hypothetical protein